MHRLQISVFGAIAIVFAVQGVTAGIFASIGSLNAMGAGWLILSIVDILWVLYFTSEEDSLVLHVFNMLGTGGLTPPSRRRRTRTQSSTHNVQGGNAYSTNYSAGAISSQDFDTKGSSAAYEGPNPNVLRTQNSFGASLIDTAKPFGSVGSIRDQPVGVTGSTSANDNGQNSPLVGPGNTSTPATNEPPPTEIYSYRAKAMYACKQ